MKTGYNTSNIKTRFMMDLVMLLHKENILLSESEQLLYKFILSRKNNLQGFRNKGKIYWSIWG